MESFTTISARSAARRSLVLAALVLAAAGCAARPAWQKPGATEAEVARDLWQCQQTIVPYTKLSPTTGRHARVRTGRDEAAACLRARGYERVGLVRGGTTAPR
jgi:hypothetical protein